MKSRTQTSSKRKKTSQVKIKTTPGGLTYQTKSGKRVEYHIHQNTETRRKILRALIKNGQSIKGPTNGLKVFRRLNVLYIYRKNKAPAEAQILSEDRNYVKATFYDTKYWS